MLIHANRQTVSSQNTTINHCWRKITLESTMLQMLPLVTIIGYIWFATPKHYLNQWWLLINHTPRNRLYWKHIKINQFLLTLNLSQVILPPFCSGAGDAGWGVGVGVIDGIKHSRMMTSSNGNIFRITGPLCGEFTGHRWIPLTKASDAELWYFLWSAPE